MRPLSPGESADSTIPLSDVTCLEFECLVDFFYNGMHEDYDPTFDEWLALLSISTHFGMDKIRQRAISQIESQPQELSPIEKILLARRYGLDGWLAPAYAALCQRAEPLQVSEAEKLGLVTMVKLAQAREQFRRSASNPMMTRPPSPDCANIARSPSPEWPIPRSPRSYPTNGRPIDDPAPSELTRAMGIVNEVFWPKPAEIFPPGRRWF